jgi:hypothetical protein
MMLATALTKMMDETECVIFMNTPRSISSGDYVKGTPTTGSPWIYYELAMSRLIRTRPPERNLPMLKVESASLRKALRIVYEVDLKHLTPLSAPDLNAWSKASKTSKKGASRLDQLYSIT